MAGAFDAKVEISTKEARDGLIALRKEVKSTADMLTVLDTALKASSKDLKSTADSLTKIVAASRQAAAGTKEMAQADIAAARAGGIRATTEAKVAETLARKANQEAQAARATAQGAAATARITDIEARRIASLDRQAAATRRAAEAQTNMHDSMSNSRYLMYDVGATYAVISAGLLAIPAATAAVSAAYQKDFAQVVRVNEEFQHSSESAQQMKDSLKGLAADMPVAFDELSRITQLGAQMGVANDKLAAFTETTAKFVAVTGISADTGATLFGRLETSFTEDVQKFPDFFERVGSAIAYVGAKTVATDPEIAAMLNQIGPLGAAAGMTAAEVTGLSAALASVRVRPELARGALTKVFANINRDVAEGSPRLAEYGKLMGITGEQAAALWKTDSSKFFTDMIAGLNGTLKKNGELTTTLDKLGIKELRVSDAMTKLAVGNDVLVKSMDAANKGFEDGTALAEMSKPVFETLVAHLTELSNAWKNFGDTIGSGALGPLGFFVDTAKNLALWLDSLAKNADGTLTPIGRLMQILMGIATITALFLGFKAAQAFVMAGMIGFQQAAARGMSGGLGLANMARTLAQTMLMAKGATDQQSRALLGQVGALRALTIASTTSSGALRAQAASTAAGGTAAAVATGRFRGMGAAMLGLVGGPIGLLIGGLALLVGHLLNTQMEAEQAGKSIAEAMAQGADSGARAVAEAFNNRKVNVMDGALGFSDVDKTVTQIAERSGVAFKKIVGSITEGEKGMKAFREELERVAKADGYKNLDDALANPMPGTRAADLQFLNSVVKKYAEENTEAAKGLKKVEEAAPLAGKGVNDAAGEFGDAALDIDEMTDALKALNDEVFGTINAEAALQASLVKIGEGLHKSQSYSPMSEGGRDNIQNFQETLTKARDYYNQLMAEGTLSAEQAASGYGEFIQGLINEIRAKGGDTSYVQELAETTRAKFEAAIGGKPISVPVTYDNVAVETAALDTVNLVQNWINSHPEPAFAIGADGTNAANELDKLVKGIMNITGLPYEVVVDAMADPAHEKAREVEALLIAITTDTYVAPVDADTSAAVANIQNFVAFARTELARVHAAANGGIGYGDGEGSMSPSQKAEYGKINTSTPVMTRVARAPVRVPSASIPASAQTGLSNLGKGYDDAAKKAAEAGKSAKKAAKDIADGIDDAVQAAEDYGNRLKTALMSAYNQQYGLTKATDEYHSALNAINKKREDEIKQVTDLRDKVRELNDERNRELISANKAKIEQGISVKYGETDRAADYGQKAQEALNNAAAKQKEIDVANKEATTIQNGIGLLTGYSDAAIANREALRNLELKTIDMIAAYASQGHSIDEVRAFAQRLNGQFQNDVIQMGYNQTAVGNLQGSLERYIEVINSVPLVKPTEVTADTEEASQEIAAFGDALGEIGRGVIVPVKAELDLAYVARQMRSIDAQIAGGGTPDDPGMTAFRPGTFAPAPAFTGGSVDKIMGFNGGGSVPGTPPANPRADNLLAKVDGQGLIGIRSKEFIQPQPAVDYYGLDFMEAIRTMRLPKFSMGGSPSGSRGGAGALQDSVVELGAATLAAMSEMRQEIKLFTENRVIAEAANAGNKQLAAEGHR